jgi:restriction system protein
MRAAVTRYREWKQTWPAEISDVVSGNVFEEDKEEEESSPPPAPSRKRRRPLGRTLATTCALSPYELQDLVAALIGAMGYHVAWVAPRGPDRGIDIIADLNPLGIKDPRIKVQVKHRPDTKTPPDQLRSFMAVLSDKDVDIFVASGGFTRDAESEARTQENRRITLIDLERLVELWIEHYGQIPDVQRQLLPLRPIHYLSAAS